MSEPKIAVFFHTRLSGGDFPEHPEAKVEPNWGASLFINQLHVLVDSGIYDNANKIIVGMNGSPIECRMLSKCIPEGIVKVYHGPESRSLIPTMRIMQQFARDNPGWMLLFMHAKGATHPHDSFTTAWRDCMTKHCVTNWCKCVSDLETGMFDAVGCHWRENSPNDPNADRWGWAGYFGGVFFWTTGVYFSKLQMLPETATDRHSFYLPELILGTGYPRVKDYHPNGPSWDCAESAKLCKVKKET